MGQKFVDVGFAQDLGVTVALCNVNTIERREDTFIAEINTVVCTDAGNEIADSCQVDAADGEVIILTADKHPLTLVHTVVKAALMGSEGETVTGAHGE